ncbi:MAG: large conductance mechanosensitive channel protein MscL [Saprospiraceae bacterium]
MWSEFKSFILRGDVLALAVAFMIAGAFQGVIDSLVKDVITPIIGLIGGQPDFSSIVIGGHPNPDPASPDRIIGGIQLGSFINAIITFLLTGFVLFLLVKSTGKKGEDVK